ncbi:MAG: outer membrane protein assembly factor BamA [Candidatus Aminicenantes bacterium]|nr:outer membrane protein assembly factor BamA [Candidatus Aminicenantes bacterium]
MKKWIIGLFLLLAPLLSFGQELIERIDIIGNERVTKETVMYYLSAREGDYYSDDILKKDFRVLWSTGFFSNIRIENEQGAKGKVVKIYLEENSVIKTISYKTGSKIKEDDIVNKLKEKDEYILPYSYYSPSRIQKIKETIEDLLAEKGLHAAKVDIETVKKGKSELDILFKIDEGPKVRVGQVEFTGKPKLPQSTLREAMKENQQISLFSWVAGKSLYKQNKLPDDVANIKKALQENGYMEATVGEPRIEEITKRSFPFFKKQKMMKIGIPVNAGYLYRVGEIKIEGNKAFSTAGIQLLIKLKKGEVYSTKIREKSVEDISELFRNYGHLYGQVIPVETLDPKNKLVNVTYQIAENDICFLRRIEFRGNIFTKDKVIRREMALREGDIFSFARFKDSILRIKQLGLVDLEKDPEVKPAPDDPTQFDVNVNVKELQRNNIQFTAGYSGYEGTFVAASYSTVNFLGAGENLEITAQYGKRIKNYVFGFTEPYLFDMPISAGFNIYDRTMIYPYLYDQKSRGVDFNFGAILVFPWRVNLTYSFQFINVQQPTETSTTTDSSGGLVTANPYLDPYYSGLFGWGKYNMSSLSPSLYRSTIDSPLTPTSGTMYLFSLKYAGTFLGGEIHMIKPNLEFTHYQPIKRGVLSLGFHIEYSFVKPLRNSQVPFWERFFLGGERNIRGYEIYSIGPRDTSGSNVGGLKSLVINAELILHVGGQDSPLYVIAFHDMGNAYALNERVSLKNIYSSTGLEARIFVPALRVPFRLIFSYNNKLIYQSDSNFAFRFAIGTTF